MRSLLDVPVYREGDVFSRMLVRVDEIRQSLAAFQRISWIGLFQARAALLLRNCLPIVRSRRGRGLARRDPALDSHRARGRLDRCKIKDPSLNNWPALVEAVQGNIVPDFPVINKSFNLSYSGTDR